VIMTGPPTNVRRKASLRLRMRSALDSVFAGEGEVYLCLGEGMALACSGSTRKQEGRPEGRPDASLGIETVARTTCPRRGIRDGGWQYFWADS
jgi:hypothetical protein